MGVANLEFMSLFIILDGTRDMSPRLMVRTPVESFPTFVEATFHACAFNPLLLALVVSTTIAHSVVHTQEHFNNECITGAQ